MTHQPIVSDQTPTPPVGAVETTLSADALIDKPYLNKTSTFWNDSYFKAIQLQGTMEFNASTTYHKYNLRPVQSANQMGPIKMSHFGVSLSHMYNGGMTVIFEAVKHPMIRSIIEVSWSDWWSPVEAFPVGFRQMQKVEWDTTQFKYCQINLHGHLLKNYRAAPFKMDDSIVTDIYTGGIDTVNTSYYGVIYLKNIAFVPSSIAPSSFDVIAYNGFTEFIPMAFKHPMAEIVTTDEKQSQIIKPLPTVSTPYNFATNRSEPLEERFRKFTT